MDGRHLEQALAVSRLEVGHLKNDRQGLDNVDEADKQQDERHIARESHACDRAAEKQRTGVAHKHLRRVEVVDQKAEQAAGQSARERGNARVADAHADRREEHRDRNRNARREAVDAVGEVDGVIRADDNERRENDVDRPRQADGDVRKRNHERGQAVRLQEEHEDEYRRD